MASVTTTSTTTTKPSYSRLLALPTELQKDIIDLLSLPSKLTLRLTCHNFYTLIPRPTHRDLLALEQTSWATTRRLYTCMDCVRLRPAIRFADAMRKGPKGLHGKEPHKRFCIDCGIHPKPRTTRYSPGAEIEVSGRRWVLCKLCRRFVEDVECVGSGVCGKCHGREGVGCVGRCASVEEMMGMNTAYYGTSRAKWRSRRYDYEDELPECYDEQFWECYDPAD